MSVIALRWARAQCTGRASTKAVLLLLADYADDNGVCWPGTRALAEDACTDQRRVRSMLDDLRALGLIAWTGEPRKTRVYQLRLDVGAKSREERTHDHRAPASATTKRRDQRMSRTEGGAPAASEGGAPAASPAPPEGGAATELRAVRPLAEGGTPSYTSRDLIDPPVCAREQQAPAPAAPVHASTDPSTGARIVTAWLESARKPPPRKVVGQVRENVAALLAEGQDPDDVRAGLALWATKGLHPNVLPSVVHEAQVQPQGRRVAGGRPSRSDQAGAAYRAAVERSGVRTVPGQVVTAADVLQLRAAAGDR